MGGRGSSPWPEAPKCDKNLGNCKTGTSTNPVTTAYHHIAPQTALSSFFDSVATESVKNRELLSKGLQVVLKSLAENYPKTKAVANAIISGSVIHDGSKSTTPEGWDDFVNYWTYLPGNTFLGPSGNLRADDPGNGFETTANTIITNTKYTQIKSAYEAIQGYMKKTTHTVSEVQAVAQKLNVIVVWKKDYFPLVANNWEAATGGKWKIKKTPTVLADQHIGSEEGEKVQDEDLLAKVDAKVEYLLQTMEVLAGRVDELLTKLNEKEQRE